MSAETLCQRCQKLGLNILFYGTYDPEKSDLRFGRLRQLWTANTCQFCLLVKEMLIAHYGKEYITQKLEQGYDQLLSLYQDPLDLSFERYAVPASKDKIPFFLAIGCYAPKALLKNPAASFRRESRTRNDDRTKDWVMPCMFVTKHQVDYSDGSWKSAIIEQPGRLVDPMEVEWGLLRQWESSCTHYGTSNSLHDNIISSCGTNLHSQLRVIDVEKACVVPFPSGAAYVALSYQWGTDQKLKLKKGNRAQLEEPGYFASPAGKPSQTIADAMTTTRRLGYRYIWIDALCIVVSIDQKPSLSRYTHFGAARR